MTRRADPRTSRLPVSATQLPAFTPVPRQCNRHDGWTEQRQRDFIEALADTGSVHAACKAVNMSQRGAYHLRRQPGGESFRAAWQAALDLGVQRIEDVAMDRALNGVDVPVYSYGKLVGKRTVYNDRLLMFILRNRAPERFAESGKSPAMKGAIGKMEKRRLKKKWRKKGEAELPERRMMEGKKARAIIEQKLEELRQRVTARKDAEWERLSEETRTAFARAEELKARDLARTAYGAAEETEALPALAETKVECEDEAAPEEHPRVRIRTAKDDGWG
ncbi:hypothetical protein [Pontixanthobacter aquaemixtae]|uniref:Uncharacterized protein n=1 Tax=Pontixanthobacter aquaemixtae TaxID=1958940 RepID=A0A844ZQ48_9SPHN|nr:hypothetical protein [Pontixanthobacter aquaemixtae]MXO90471.1 hypothetical protein [Pontixanthobacter aquaemixtae]